MYSKLRYGLFFTMLILGAIFWSCNQNKVEELSTELRVTVNIDSIPTANAKVKLYRTLVDMETRTAATDSAITDGKGQVVFKGLKSVLYYVHAYYADENFYYDNSTAQSRLNDDLIDGAVTVANIQLKNKRTNLPSKIRFKTIEVISFDTVNYNKAENSNCSNNLLFEIVAIDNLYNETIVNTIDKSQSIQYCVVAGKAITDNSSPINGQPQLEYKNKFESLVLAAKYIQGQTIQDYPPGFFTLNISSFNLRSYWNDEFIKGYPLPNRIRLMEGQVKIPRNIKTIVDIKVDWE